MPRTPADPHIELRFGTRRVRPEQITFAALRRAVEALQQILSGPEAEDPDQRVRLALVQIRRGSAVFRFSSEEPRACSANLRRIGRAVRQGEMDDSTAYAADALRVLSRLSEHYACPVSVTMQNRRETCELRIDTDTYARLAETAFARGELTTVAYLARVGGATAPRCVLRLPDQRRVLFCPVVSHRLARQMAVSLYGWIVASGPGTWLRQTKRIVEFSVHAFRPLATGSLQQRCRQLRDASGGVWDRIDDPEQYLTEYAGD